MAGPPGNAVHDGRHGSDDVVHDASDEGNGDGHHGPTPGSDDAVVVARRRLAAGEISPEEFGRVMGVLGDGGGRSQQPRTSLMMLGVTAAVVLLVTVAVMFAWMASAGPWDNWGWGGMGHMGGWGRTSNSAPTSATVEGSNASVAIEDFRYAPGDLTIRPGTVVTWTNEDSVPHSATARDDSWDTGLFERSNSQSVTFADEGTYGYYCSIHPSMEGVVRVQR